MTDNSVHQRQALELLYREMEFQSERWGSEHDKEHTPEEWMTIIMVYVGKAAHQTAPYTEGSDPNRSNQQFKKRLVQLGAICASALAAMEP